MHQTDTKQTIFLLIAAVFASLIVGALIFSLTEGWSLSDSIYFTTMTATTVGYGDFTPVTPMGKFFTIIFALSIIPFVLYTFSYVAKAQIEKVYNKIYHLEKQQREQEREISMAEKELEQQKSELRKQEEIIKKEKEEIEMQKRRIEEEIKMNTLQNSELLQENKELEIVENVMEEALKTSC